MNMEIIAAVKKRMKEELLPRQMEKLEIVLHEVFQEQENKKEKKNLVKKFINVKRIEGCSKRTEEYYESTLSFYEKHIDNDICSVGTEEIRNYLLRYQKINNCSNVTLDTVRRILSTFYRWLEEEDYIIKSPMKRIRRIKAPVILKPAFTEEQIELLRSEAAGDVRNVAKQREIYFDVRTKIELENYLKTRKDKSRALFVTSRRKNGAYTRLTVNSIEKMIREMGDKTDIPNVHPHRFRRTMATRAIDKGMPIEQVQVLLGHSKIDTTLRYANVQQANVRHSHQKYIC